jgi:hypothetical protein
MKKHGKDQLEEATYQPRDYGRMIRAEGTEPWKLRDMRFWLERAEAES